MVLSQLMVLSTLCMMSGCFKGLVPMDNVLMVCGSMKLCVAPQSSSASIWVILCHMLTVREIVIEFFCVLYMWATDAGVLATVKLQQTKNPDPCLGHLNTWLFLLQPWLLLVRGFVGP